VNSSFCTRAAIVATTVLSIIVSAANGNAQMKKPGWVVAWTSSMQGLAQNAAPSNATLRMVVRPSIGGDAMRIRLENTFGMAPVTIGAASVALRARLSSIVPGSSVPLRFGGQESVTIPAGGKVLSDETKVKVDAMEDLAVDLYLPGEKVALTAHNGAFATSYLTADGSGNHVGESGAPNGAFATTTTSMYFVSSVQVQTSSAQGGIVAFGDSITDGTCSTLDANDRWEDMLRLRLQLDRGPGWALVNEGIAGNTVTRKGLDPPAASPPGTERLDRDVLEHSGATHVILFEATNDIRRGATADAVIAGLQDIIRRLHAAKLKVIGVTIIPRDGSMGWVPPMNAARNAVNDWIRHRAGFDAVIDFDKIVADPRQPDQMLPAYNCGDSVHPNPFGYSVLGRSIDLKLFK
jgi:lysophospholipase L1-like esterase